MCRQVRHSSKSEVGSSLHFTQTPDLATFESRIFSSLLQEFSELHEFVPQPSPDPHPCPDPHDIAARITSSCDSTILQNLKHHETLSDFCTPQCTRIETLNPNLRTGVRGFITISRNPPDLHTSPNLSLCRSRVQGLTRPLGRLHHTP